MQNRCSCVWEKANEIKEFYYYLTSDICAAAAFWIIIMSAALLLSGLIMISVAILVKNLLDPAVYVMISGISLLMVSGIIIGCRYCLILVGKNNNSILIQ